MRAFLVWGALAFVVAGCGDNPEAARFILGEAREADGGAWKRGALVLERAVPSTDGGLAPPTEFEPYRDVPVDPDGRFAVELFSFETSYWATYQFPVGPGAPDGGPGETRTVVTLQPHTFRVRLPLEQGEAWVETRDLIYTLDAELPPLRPWAASPRVEEGPGDSRKLLVAAPPLRTLPRYEDRFLHVDTRLEVRSDAGVLWRVDAEPPQAGPDGGLHERPLELELFPELSEGSGALTVIGQRDEGGVWGRREVFGGESSFTSRLSTAPLVLEQTAGPIPVSRGAPCAPDGGGVCHLTNGVVEPFCNLSVGSTPQAPCHAMPLVFSRPVQARLLILRNVYALMSGSAVLLRVVGRTEQGTEVELARWELPQPGPGPDGTRKDWRFYLRANVPTGLPPIVGVELRGETEDVRPFSAPQDTTVNPHLVTLFAGEISVFE